MNAESAAGARRLQLAAFLLLAAILTAVVLLTLLLLGADPHLVFLPGHFVKDSLGSLGLRVPNPVGVLTTFAVWWFIVVAVWTGLRRLRKR
jgi:hypothetical protein